MKRKILAMMLIAMMAVNVTACGSSSDKSAKADKAAKETTKDKKEDSAGSEKSDDEMSQAEWVEKNASSTEDGYDIVDSIDITSSTTTLKYTGSKIIDDTGEDGTTSKKVLLYFDFTNVNDSETSAESHYNFRVYQNGIQLDQWISMNNYDFSDESFDNTMKAILSGTTVNIAVVFELQDETSPLKLRVDNSLDDNGETQLFAQQQEIQLQ